MPRCLRIINTALRAPRPPAAASATRKNAAVAVNRWVAQNASTSTASASLSAGLFSSKPSVLSYAKSGKSEELAQTFKPLGPTTSFSTPIKPSILPSSLQPTILSSVLPSSLFSTHLFQHSSLLRLSPLIHAQSQSLSPHPNPHALQMRFKAYGTEYQPSQRVRKRRHGFLARKRTASGRKILVRRRAKGRRYVSH